MIPLSGLDGTIPALQHILAGEQTFTVYFSYGTQATLAGNLAVQLLKGEAPTGITTSVDNEGVKVPAMMIDPITVRSDNIEETVIADGLITWKDICVGEYAQYLPRGRGPVAAAGRKGRGSDACTDDGRLTEPDEATEPRLSAQSRPYTGPAASARTRSRDGAVNAHCQAAR